MKHNASEAMSGISATPSPKNPALIATEAADSGCDSTADRVVSATPSRVAETVFCGAHVKCITQ